MIARQYIMHSANNLNKKAGGIKNTLQPISVIW